MPRGAPKGHKKYGGGIKKGERHKKSIAVEAALETYKQEMLRELKPILTSQLQSAKGLFVVLRRRLVRKKVGKRNILVREGELEQVKDPFEIERLLNSDGQGDDWHIITSKEPNIVALKDILDRVFGKPQETIEHKGDVRLLIVDL
jgi:hypothetical protein